MTLPPQTKPQDEKVLYSRVKMKIRHDTYMEHPIKWNKLPKVEVSWVFESDIFFWELMVHWCT